MQLATERERELVRELFKSMPPISRREQAASSDTFRRNASVPFGLFSFAPSSYPAAGGSSSQSNAPNRSAVSSDEARQGIERRPCLSNQNAALFNIHPAAAGAAASIAGS